MKPNIFLSLPEKNADNYLNAIEKCGATAIGASVSTVGTAPIVPTDCDGLVLCGGGDILPQLYSKETDLAKSIDYRRDIFELGLMRSFLSLKKPILGICRGMQVINVALGGSLYPDICDESKKIHTPLGNDDYIHEVFCKKDSLIQSIYGDSFNVNSHHHQAIDITGYGLYATATASDGVTECIEHKTLPIIGVQWHPERLSLKYKNPSAPDGLKLIEYFVNLCKKK